MKITKRELKQMINESVREVLFEHGRGARFRDRTDDRWVDPLEVKSEEYQRELDKRHRDKMVNRFKMLVQKIKDVLPELSFSVDEKYYSWELHLREFFTPMLNAADHSKHLHFADHSDLTGYYIISGQYSDKSLNELERIVNRL